MKTDLLDTGGKKLKGVDLDPSVFEVKENIPVVHQVVKAQLAGERAGTADTKERSEVRGGGRKPWRQKGTGRARAGSIRSPLWRGGGTTFGPTPRNYTQKVSRKLGKLALRIVLSAKARDGELRVLKAFGLKEPATKEAKKILDGLNSTGKVTVVVADDDENALLSLRNLPRARAIKVSQINAYDLTDCASIIITQDALDKVTEVLSVEKR